MIEYTISAGIGYALGSLQSAYFLGKWYLKLDIRQHGTHNIGASNATVVLGRKLGFITLVMDIFKALLTVILVRLIFGSNSDLLFWAGSWAVLGHIFPVYLGFKGGKGVASLLGMLIIVNWQLGLTAAGILLAVTFLTDYIALGALILYGTLPILLMIHHFSMLSILMSLLLLLIGIWKHIDNLERIKNRTERKVRRTLSSKISREH